MKQNKQPGNPKDELIETNMMQKDLDDMSMRINGQDIQKSDQERNMNYR
jgi:hypothetical protein